MGGMRWAGLSVEYHPVLVVKLREIWSDERQATKLMKQTEDALNIEY